MEPQAGTIQSAVDATSGMSITVDIADVISAVIWPLSLLITVLLSKRHIPAFLAPRPCVIDCAEQISPGRIDRPGQNRDSAWRAL